MCVCSLHDLPGRQNVFKPRRAGGFSRRLCLCHFFLLQWPCCIKVHLKTGKLRCVVFEVMPFSPLWAHARRT